MGIIAWIIFGLIAGVIAKLIMPGRDGGGFILTCILGVVGAVVGGWLATMFGIGGDVSGFNLHSFLVAVVGAWGWPGVLALVALGAAIAALLSMRWVTVVFRPLIEPRVDWMLRRD